MIIYSHISLYLATSKVRVFPFLVITRTSNRISIAKLLVPRGQTNTTRLHRSISSYIYIKHLFPHSTYSSRADERTPHALIAIYRYIYTKHMRSPRVYVCSIIFTHAYEPLPYQSSWFSRVHQVNPCISPGSGHYPLSNGVRNPVHTWVLLTIG